MTSSGLTKQICDNEINPVGDRCIIEVISLALGWLLLLTEIWGHVSVRRIIWRLMFVPWDPPISGFSPDWAIKPSVARPFIIFWFRFIAHRLKLIVNSVGKKNSRSVKVGIYWVQIKTKSRPAFVCCISIINISHIVDNSVYSRYSVHVQCCWIHTEAYKGFEGRQIKIRKRREFTWASTFWLQLIPNMF